MEIISLESVNSSNIFANRILLSQVFSLSQFYSLISISNKRELDIRCTIQGDRLCNGRISKYHSKHDRHLYSYLQMYKLLLLKIKQIYLCVEAYCPSYFRDLS